MDFKRRMMEFSKPERCCFLFSYSPSRQVFIPSHTWSHAVLLLVIGIINLKFDTNPLFSDTLSSHCNFMTEKEENDKHDLIYRKFHDKTSVL